MITLKSEAYSEGRGYGGSAPPGAVKSLVSGGFSGPNRCLAPSLERKKSSPTGKIPEYTPN